MDAGAEPGFRAGMGVPGDPWGSLCVPVQPGLILLSLLRVQQGDAESPGRGDVVEVKHGSTPVPWLGLGDPGGLQGCCQLPGVPVLWHRSSLAEGWGTALLSQQVHWVMSQGTGEAPGGIWGRHGPRGVSSEILRAEMLPPVPRTPWPHMAPQEKGWPYSAPVGDSCAGSPWGTV